jgi:hypothetical protein
VAFSNLQKDGGIPASNRLPPQQSKPLPGFYEQIGPSAVRLDGFYCNGWQRERSRKLNLPNFLARLIFAAFSAYLWDLLRGSQMRQ